MAFGSKLGKVFGAIGSGLSFVPGPWSALGLAFSAAGTAASAVGEAKDRRQLQAERNQETLQALPPIPQPDLSRPDNQQLNDSAQAVQPPQRSSLYRPSASEYNLGNYQQQINMDIARSLARPMGYDDERF